MRSRLDIAEDNRNLYTFHSAKKIYLAHTPEKYILMEKNEKQSAADRRVLSLLSRNTVVISRDGGMLLFPKNK